MLLHAVSGKSRRIWEGGPRLVLKEARGEGVRWIYLPQGGVQLRAPVNTCELPKKVPRPWVTVLQARSTFCVVRAASSKFGLHVS